MLTNRDIDSIVKIAEEMEVQPTLTNREKIRKHVDTGLDVAKMVGGAAIAPLAMLSNIKPHAVVKDI